MPFRLPLCGVRTVNSAYNFTMLNATRGVRESVCMYDADVRYMTLTTTHFSKMAPGPFITAIQCATRRASVRVCNVVKTHYLCNLCAYGCSPPCCVLLCGNKRKRIKEQRAVKIKYLRNASLRSRITHVGRAR